MVLFASVLLLPSLLLLSEAAGGGKLGSSNVQEEVLMPFNRFRFNPGFQRTELGTTSINTWREVSMGLMLGVF